MATSVRMRVLRGLGANAFGQLVNAVIQIASLPAFLSMWGVERYGDWIILSSWASLLSMSDVGFALAAGNEMTMRVSRGDRDGALGIYQSTWLALTIGTSLLLVAIVSLLFGTPAVALLPLKTVAPDTAGVLLAILAAHVLLTFQLGLIDVGFRCDGNFSLGVMLSSLTRLVEFIVQLAVAFACHSMISVAAAGIGVRVAAGTISWGVLRRRSPWLSMGWGEARLSTIRPLASPAVAFLGMPLGNAVTYQGMIQITAAALGPLAVVAFSAHRTIANVATQLMNMVNNAVWPEISRAYGAGDTPLTRRLHRIACSTSVWLAAVCCLGMISTSWWIIPVWSRGKICIHVALTFGFALCILLRTMWYTSAVVPMSTNRHRRIVTSYFTASVASLIIAAIGIRRFGLGITSFSVAAVDLTMTLLVLRISLDLTGDTCRGFMESLWRPPAWEVIRGARGY